ncbi:MAG: hypothetical protein ACTFAK_10125 [Candidatus Electronema sp. VV]
MDMKKPWLLAKWAFIAYALVCTLVMTTFIVAISYKILIGNRGSDAPASKKDAERIMNWCGLDKNRVDEVLHSHISARSFSGDYLDAHAIRLSSLEEHELLKNETADGWFRCDQASGVLKDALDFAAAWVPSSEVPWFPSEKEVRSKEMYVKSWTLRYDGSMLSEAVLIFVRPRDKMLFFVSVKT